MQRKYWVISDTHFGHANILNFKDNDGRPTRPFSSVEEMNETMVENWNSVVRPNDNVYHLGDVFFGSKDSFKELWPRLNGRKTLILGNHDNAYFLSGKYERKTKKGKTIEEKYFRDILLFKQFGRFILSHTPLHPSTFQERHRCGRENMINIHGHIHQNPSPEGPYKCVSVEQTNYTPVDIFEINDHLLRSAIL